MQKNNIDSHLYFQQACFDCSDGIVETGIFPKQKQNKNYSKFSSGNKYLHFNTRIINIYSHFDYHNVNINIYLLSPAYLKIFKFSFKGILLLILGKYCYKIAAVVFQIFLILFPSNDFRFQV